MIQLIYLNLLFSAWCLRHDRVLQKDRCLATSWLTLCRNGRSIDGSPQAGKPQDAVGFGG